jgi:hypothetical protein
MAVPVSPFVGLKGIQGPIYRLEPSNNSVYLDETTGLPVVQDATGFYRVELKLRDEIEKKVVIEITPYPSKKKFIKNKSASSYGGFIIRYHVSNIDQTLDESGNIVTAGTYDTWFERSVVRANNTCETDKARDFVLTLTGALSDGTHIRFQDGFPINFSAMAVENITQANVTSALA